MIEVEMILLFDTFWILCVTDIDDLLIKQKLKDRISVL